MSAGEGEMSGMGYPISRLCSAKDVGDRIWPQSSGEAPEGSSSLSSGLVMVPPCASSRSCSEWRHTANKHPAESRITYRFHPRFGETVEIRRRLAEQKVFGFQ
jgi:hypothetical protein